jgi:hypothetical protein
MKASSGSLRSGRDNEAGLETVPPLFSECPYSGILERIEKPENFSILYAEMKLL